MYLSPSRVVFKTRRKKSALKIRNDGSVATKTTKYPGSAISSEDSKPESSHLLSEITIVPTLRARWNNTT